MRGNEMDFKIGDSLESRADINEIISKIREVSNKTKIFSEPTSLAEPSQFESVLSIAKNAVSDVNQMQMNSESLKTAFISGEGNVSMSQVVVAAQKSKLAFEGLVAVRNKILEAYKEIMNMPV